METSITNCKITKESATGGSSAKDKCSECNTGFIPSSDSTSCLSCSAVSSHCADDKLVAGETACECSECDEGYYLDTDKSCTKDLPTNCILTSLTTTSEKDCFICKLGYKWNDTDK